MLRRISNKLDRGINHSQHAYCSEKSTSDIVLAHKLLIAGSIERDMNPTVIGIDMSKAFDTVIRSQLIHMLDEYICDKGTMNIIQMLLKNTTLAVKIGAKTSEKFSTNMGVPQGDALAKIA